MTRHVAEAIQDKTTLLIEAGTGVGKTFAYLVPAMLSGKKVIVSTGTRYLQDQLFNKDIPVLSHLLESDRKIALLKGRANYLCRERFEQQWHQPDLNRAQRSLVDEIHAWAQTSSSGDISHFKQLSEDDPLWQSMTSTVENCLGTKCPHYEDCFVHRARKQAVAADVIIVNHYLLLADLSLKDEGFGQLLPAVDSIIVDEAHQLDEVADYFFAEGIGSRQIENLLNDLTNTEALKGIAGLTDCLQRVQPGIASVQKELSTQPDRGDTQTLLAIETFTHAWKQLQDCLESLEHLLEKHRDYHEIVEHCCERVQQLVENFQHVLEPGANRISWYQKDQGSFLFHLHYAETAELLEQKYSLYDANWIFTSATLSINNRFDYARRKLGVKEDSKCIALAPAFNFKKQAILYIPLTLPEPGQPEHIEQFVEESLDLVQQIDGSALFLFTSHRALSFAAEKITQLKQRRVFVQGDAPKLELVSLFREHANSLLLGTMGFWEGLDMQGTRLRCVFIDKLPFAPPHEPLSRGRQRLLAAKGENFFAAHALPAAVVSLRQGVGRLIRDVSDHGVIFLGDPRIYRKSYGRVFLRSLPAMPVCHDVKETLPYLQ